MKKDYFSMMTQKMLQPDSTFGTGAEELWTEFETKTGFILPADYKKIINFYGTGGIGNFIWLLTPFAQDENVNFEKRAHIMLDAYVTSKSKFPNYFIFNIYPNEGGILPWGYTENGDELYWKTNDSSDNWTIVVYESSSPNYSSYEMPLSEFLYKLINCELKSNILSNQLENTNYIAVNII